MRTGLPAAHAGWDQRGGGEAADGGKGRRWCSAREETLVVRSLAWMMRVQYVEAREVRWWILQRVEERAHSRRPLLVLLRRRVAKGRHTSPTRRTFRLRVRRRGQAGRLPGRGAGWSHRSARRASRGLHAARLRQSRGCRDPSRKGGWVLLLLRTLPWTLLLPGRGSTRLWDPRMNGTGLWYPRTFPSLLQEDWRVQ